MSDWLLQQQLPSALTFLFGQRQSAGAGTRGATATHTDTTIRRRESTLSSLLPHIDRILSQEESAARAGSDCVQQNNFVPETEKFDLLEPSAASCACIMSAFH